MGADVSGMSFLLDLVETGELRVVTCTTPHGKAASPIPAPFGPDVLHSPLADIEKALIRSYSPVTTRRATPVAKPSARLPAQTPLGVHTTYGPSVNEAPGKQTLYVPPTGSTRHLRRLDNGCWGRAR
jgi:hypothetical protein